MRIYITAAIFGLMMASNSVSAQETTSVENRYNDLAKQADVCVTDPCPVSRQNVTILGISVEAIVYELPDRKVYYVLPSNAGVEIKGERSKSLWICTPKNYVEVEPDVDCYGI